jgi:1,4-alpha-glucan branching enzyme
LLSSDDQDWGGSGFGRFESVSTDDSPAHGYEQSIEIALPPLCALVLAPSRP